MAELEDENIAEHAEEIVGVAKRTDDASKTVVGVTFVLPTFVVVSIVAVCFETIFGQIWVTCSTPSPIVLANP